MSQKKPVAALITWLFARQKNVNKYVEMYEKMGFETVVLKPSIGEIFRPKTIAARSGQKLLQNLCNESNKDKDIFVCTFSMGAYMFSQTLGELKNPPKGFEKEYEKFPSRVKAQLFDSPVDLEGVPNGVAHGLTKNAIFRAGILFSVNAFLLLAYPFVTRHLKTASDRFKYNVPIKAKSLWITSDSDPVADVKKVTHVVETWRNKLNIDCEYLILPESRHVAHIIDHPELYQSTIETFLQKNFENLNIDSKK